MKLKKRLKNLCEDGLLIAASALILVILEYETLIRKRNENR